MDQCDLNQITFWFGGNAFAHTYTNTTDVQHLNLTMRSMASSTCTKLVWSVLNIQVDNFICSP